MTDRSYHTTFIITRFLELNAHFDLFFRCQTRLRLRTPVKTRFARIRRSLSSRALENGFRKTFKERHHANLREDP